MNFDEKLSMLISEAEIPEQLSPENIALMLKQKTADKNKKPSVPAISMKSKKQAMIFRSTAAIAACFALVFGIMAFVNNKGTALPAGYLDNDVEVREAENYSDVYKGIQDAFVKNGKIIDDESNISYPNKTSSDTKGNVITAGTQIKTKAQDINTVVEYSMTSEKVEGVAEADILRTDGNNLYYIANDALYIVSTNNGKMTLLSKTQRNNIYPVEMYIDQNKLTVISNNVDEVPYQIKQAETTAKASEPVVSTVTSVSGKAEGGSTAAAPQSAEVTPVVSTVPGTTAAPVTSSVSASTASTTGTDTSTAESTVPSTILRSNVVVEIYDISDKNAPKLTMTYKQSGTYISSRMIESSLYLVSNYSKYQTKPLENQDDLDNYVPAYYINDVKTYIDAKNICIPSKVVSTSYAVVSGLNVQGEKPLTSIKAVLGNVRDIYCSTSNLYLIGNAASAKDKDNSSITCFKINKGNVGYSANASVEGTMINQLSMSEYDNNFRIATTTTDSKSDKHHSSIFILGTDLKPIGSISNLCGEKTIQTVRFDKNTAYVVTAEDKAPITIALTDKENPKQVNDKSSNSNSAFLYKYSDNRLIGLGTELDEKGKQKGLKLSMFDSTNASSPKEIFSTPLKGSLSEAFADAVINRKALLIDSTNNIIGVPTVSGDQYGIKNYYYVFSYDETKGFIAKGILDYSDVDKNCEFNRGLFIGDVFYALSNGRIVSAQISDLKVIEALTLK